MAWSNAIFMKLKELKKAILKKKIMMSLIIDSYALWDKLYRWTHMTFALIIPVMAVAQDIAITTGASNNIILAFGCVVVGMLKLKEYIPYDKVRDSAKEQTLKYGNLFDAIERELLKPAHLRQAEDDFFFWVSREFNAIELADPDLSADDKKKFIAICKEKGIPYDDDVNALELLMTGKDASYNNESKTDKIITINSDDNNNNADNNPDKLTSTIADSMADIPQLHRAATMHMSPSDLVKLSKSEKLEDKKKYNDTLKNMDTKADLKWALERLASLEDA
jgi:hypothetical protein